MASKHHTVTRPSSFNSPWVCREEFMGKHPYIWRAEAPGQCLCPIPLQGRGCPVPEWPGCQSSCLATSLPSPVLQEAARDSKRKPWVNRGKYQHTTWTLQPPAALRAVPSSDSSWRSPGALLCPGREMLGQPGPRQSSPCT